MLPHCDPERCSRTAVLPDRKKPEVIIMPTRETNSLPGVSFLRWQKVSSALTATLLVAGYKEGTAALAGKAELEG